MTESTPNYNNFTSEQLKQASEFVCGMILEANDDTWRNGLLLELGRLTFTLSTREPDEQA